MTPHLQRLLQSFSLIAILLLSIPAYAQWSSDPSANTNIVTDQFDSSFPVAETDGNGGLYVFWMDAAAQPPIAKIRGQYLDRKGIRVWPEAGKSFSDTVGFASPPNITHDGEGGVIAAWTVRSPSAVVVKRIKGNGKVLWSLRLWEGVNQSGGQVLLVPDGEGGVFVAGKDYTPGYRLQRIDADGALLWGSNGTLCFDGMETSVTGLLEIMRADGQGGLIAVALLNSHAGVPRSIVAQRLNSSGQRMWGDLGTRVTQTLRQNDPNRTLTTPKLAIGGSDEIYISWSDRYRGEVGMQRFTDAGSPVWPDSGITFEDSLYFNPLTSYLTVLKDGSQLIGWNVRTTDTTVRSYVQRISDDGAKMWFGGFPLDFNTGHALFGVYPHTAGGAYIISGVVQSNEGIDLYAQHILENSARAWGGYGKVISNVDSRKNPSYGHHTGIAQCIVADGKGGLFTVWEDYRNSETIKDLFAAYIDADGNLIADTDVAVAALPASADSPALFPPAPNPAGSYIDVSYALSEASPVSIRILDVLGREIASRTHSNVGTGIQRNRMALYGMQPGTYFILMRTSHGTLIQKFVKQ